MSEAGSVKAWVLAFVVAAGVGLGGLIGIGCAVDANFCPWQSPGTITSTDGEELYTVLCVACHAADGSGRRGPTLIAGPAASYDRDELRSKIARGKPLAGMPRFENDPRLVNREAQLDALAGYVISLRGGA